jgi:hypothetical protein
MPEADQPRAAEIEDLSKRLEFLYRIVEDTQNTIRFIDAKAVFCVTLLTGMVAAAGLQRSQSAHTSRWVLFDVFMIAVAITLLVCLRVIFPTIRSHALKIRPGSPNFFIGQNRGRQWFLHTIRSKVDNILNETPDSYFAKVSAATIFDLTSSMCDEVLMISLIRQIKSDRLHAAMLCLAGSLLLFVMFMLI